MPLYTKAGQLVIGNNKLATSNECCCCCGTPTYTCNSCTHPSSVTVSGLGSVFYRWYDDAGLCCCPACPTIYQTKQLPSSMTLTRCPNLCTGYVYRGLGGLGASWSTWQQKCSSYCEPPSTCCDCVNDPTNVSCLESISLAMSVLVTLRFLPTTGINCPEGVGSWTLNWGIVGENKICCSCGSSDTITPLLECSTDINDNGLRSYEPCSDHSITYPNSPYLIGSPTSASDLTTGLTCSSALLQKVNTLKGIPCQDHMTRNNPCDPTGIYTGATVTGVALSFTVA